MFVRRWVADVALAVLIAFPAVLPASQTMRTAAVHTAPPTVPAPISISSMPSLVR
jgi:hypothetical protein